MFPFSTGGPQRRQRLRSEVEGDDPPDAMHRAYVGSQPTQRSRRRHYRVRHGAWRRTAAENLGDVPVLDIGGRVVTCPFCAALRWRDETVGLCCREGRVQLPALEQPPALLWRLLLGNDQKKKVECWL